MKYISAILLIFISSHSNAIIHKTRVVDTAKIAYNYVSYNATQDNSNIYINLSTKDKKTMLTLLRFGVTVYFDVNGVENENVYIKYPQKIVQPEFKINDVYDLDQATDNLDLRKLIKTLPKEAEYGYFESVQQFHIDLNSLDIEVAFSSNKKEILEYMLRIPKNKIVHGSETDFTKLSIGVLSGKSDIINSKLDDAFVIPSLRMNDNDISRNRRVGRRRQSYVRNRKGGRVSRKNDSYKKDYVKPTKEEEPLMPVINFWFDTNLKT